MKQKPQAVLFDLDGTLIDTYQLILVSFRHATTQVLGRVIPDEELMAKVGQPLSTQMWDWTDDPAVHEELLTVYRTFNHAVHDEMIRSFDGVANALAQLKANGVKMGVVTSKLHWLANRGLECCGLAQYMDVLMGPDDYEGEKPNPEPVVAGCAALNADPAECWYVGDSPYDIAAGNGAGCRTIAVDWGMFSKESLMEQNPTVYCYTPDEMLQVLWNR